MAFTPLQNATGAPRDLVAARVSDHGLPIGMMSASTVRQDKRLLELPGEPQHARRWQRMQDAS
ncbi:hypothetical protein MDOR_13850 [Mycolicibacterium doricum]|uniref:Uncharacterized protein n=1 Tax=Mycolicibacterium doricum TaxID=126673 RepID=A0A1X1SXG4_9MYCO|nr:hypothetical protein [Mycolicibacterium doricum]MCV7266689.1 hypothetical protein [Mycolicibacterium doricum]ORV35740.1 hypothetical protein AWC01_18200 [Mycolicibacterium doricum]BBZ07216.1 hypothetical protein MDOR_13850 [Mycolicibacterium doricum]